MERTGSASAPSTPPDPGSSGEPTIYRYGELTRVERRKRVAAAVVVLVHATCVLVTGAPDWFRDRVWGAIAWYGDGLRMTNKWGMFSKPPRRAEVVVLADPRGGEPFELSTNLQTRRGPWERVVDTRIRKIQGNAIREENRHHYSQTMLEYYCRLARERDPRVWRTRVEVRTPEGLDDDGNVVTRPSVKTEVHRVCRSRGPRG